jgi:hypothetical protein
MSELIPRVLLKFQEKRIGVISDINKAFLQISVNQQDQDYLRFLWWRRDDQEKTRVFHHRRVIFGVNCSLSC